VLELRRAHAFPVTTLTPRIAGLLLLPPLLWAGNAVVGRLLVGTVPPLLLNFLRWTLALAILLPMAWPTVSTREARQRVRERWPALAALGLFGVGAYNALQYLALTTSTPLNVTLIASSSPVWMLGIGWLVFGDRPSRAAMAGAVLSLLGVAVVLSRGDASQLLQVRFVPGDLLMLLAIASWAIYSWMLVRPPASIAGDARPRQWDWAAFLLVQTLFGTLWAGSFAGLEAWMAPQPVRWSGWVVVALVYVAIGPSLIAYRCWGIGVAAVGPAIAAFFANLTPVFAALLSAALLGEAPKPYHAAAFALIVAGIAVSSRRQLRE
jgi:drug/metabolite transporter (DMT)-like permease